jgi:hypothetical protein
LFLDGWDGHLLIFHLLVKLPSFYVLNYFVIRIIFSH